MKLFSIVFILLLALPAHASWESILNPALLGFPDSQSLLMPWQRNNDFGHDQENGPEAIERVALNCPLDRLWATHPQEATKEYVFAVWAPYKHEEHSPAVVVVMSDLFEDECGNTYKGFWIVPFLRDAETMETLLSKGRTLMKKPHGFPGEFIPGGTYPLPSSAFLFLTYPSGSDVENISTLRQKALDSQYVLLNRFRWVKEIR